FEALGDPDSAAVVERHRDGVDDLRLAGDQLDRESLVYGHAPDRFLRGIRPIRRTVLAMGNHLRLVGRSGIADQPQIQGRGLTPATHRGSPSRIAAAFSTFPAACPAYGVDVRHTRAY